MRLFLYRMYTCELTLFRMDKDKRNIETLCTSNAQLGSLRVSIRKSHNNITHNPFTHCYSCRTYFNSVFRKIACLASERVRYHTLWFFSRSILHCIWRVVLHRPKRSTIIFTLPSLSPETLQTFASWLNQPGHSFSCPVPLSPCPRYLSLPEQNPIHIQRQHKHACPASILILCRRNSFPSDSWISVRCPRSQTFHTSA